MSHELRTPLNAVIGLTGMVREDAVDDELVDFIEPLERIERAGKHLLHLINEVLDLSKIEAGRIDLLVERFDVRTLVSELVSTAQPLADKNSNHLTLQCADDIGDMWADSMRVRQILLNLLSNACKFTDSGEVGLTVAVDSAGERIRMDVADSGIGLTGEKIERLFEEFSQADSSTTRKYGGTGLGLAISRRLSQLMDGDIVVESEFGKGSRFTVDLPLGRSPTESTHGRDPAQTGAVGPNDRSSRGLALVIDDDATVHDIMRRHLAREGFDVVSADDGTRGLRLARELRPAVITLDVFMPGLDGWSVLKELKEDPDLSAIPVVMVTIADERSKGFALGASDYLGKPVDRALLRRALDRHRGSGSAGKALIVEDDPSTRDVLSRAVHAEGWEVRTAENGRVGLERVAESAPDLILLDLMMPEMDGFQFLSHLRQTHSMPVIVVTAADLNADDRARLNGGVSHVVEKSELSDEKLSDVLRAALSEHKTYPGDGANAPTAGDSDEEQQ
jgi:adenylate cyclase